MVTYSLRGSLQNLEGRLNISGKIVADPNVLLVERKCTLSGHLSDNLPRSSKPGFSGYAQIMGNCTRLYFFQNSTSSEYNSAIFNLFRLNGTVGLEGHYRGGWLLLPDELAKRASDQPSLPELNELLYKTKYEHENSPQGVELTLTMGKAYRVAEKIKTGLNRLTPKPVLDYRG